MSLWAPKDASRPCGPRGGTPPTTQGKDSSPHPSCWVITKTEEQENTKWKEVLRATDGSLAEVESMLMAAIGETVWDPPQGETGISTGPHINLCHCPQAE